MITRVLEGRGIVAGKRHNWETSQEAAMAGVQAGDDASRSRVAVVEVEGRG